MFLPMNSSSFHRRKYAAGKFECLNYIWRHTMNSKYIQFVLNFVISGATTIPHDLHRCSWCLVVCCVCIRFGFRAISFIHFVAMDDVCECFGQNTTNEKLDSHEYAYIICTFGISSEKAENKEWKKRQNSMRNFVQPGALHWWINETCFFTSAKCFDFIVSSFIGRFLFLLLCCCSLVVHWFHTKQFTSFRSITINSLPQHRQTWRHSVAGCKTKGERYTNKRIHTHTDTRIHLHKSVELSTSTTFAFGNSHTSDITHTYAIPFNFSDSTQTHQTQRLTQSSASPKYRESSVCFVIFYFHFGSFEHFVAFSISEGTAQNRRVKICRSETRETFSVSCKQEK